MRLPRFYLLDVRHHSDHLAKPALPNVRFRRLQQAAEPGEYATALSTDQTKMAAPAQPDFERLFQGLLHWHDLLTAEHYNIAPINEELLNSVAQKLDSKDLGKGLA